MNAISAQADAERRPPREGNSRCVLLVGVLMIIEKSWALLFCLTLESRQNIRLFSSCGEVRVRGE
jgi:hypothetical protein